MEGWCGNSEGWKDGVMCWSDGGQGVGGGLLVHGSGQVYKCIRLNCGGWMGQQGHCGEVECQSSSILLTGTALGVLYLPSVARLSFFLSHSLAPFIGERRGTV